MERLNIKGSKEFIKQEIIFIKLKSLKNIVFKMKTY